MVFASPSEVNPCHFEMLRYIDGSFVAMNAAHDLDSLDNNRIVVVGRHWMISSQFSTGSMESII